VGNVLKGIGGRKYGLVMLVLLTTFGFTLCDVVAKEDFIALAKMLLVSYPTAAVGQSFLVKEDSESAIYQDDARKFLLSLAVFATIVVLLYLRKLPSALYVEQCQWLVGTYLTGNVLSKAVDNGVNITIGKKT